MNERLMDAERGGARTSDAAVGADGAAPCASGFGRRSCSRCPGRRRGCPRARGLLGLVASAWGLTGAAALLVRAIWSLASTSSDAFRSGLEPWHWGLAAGWAALMCFFQGYLGFQRGFSSRVVARALHLARHPRVADVVLAPLFCMGLIHANRGRTIRSWSVIAVMLVLVMAVSRVPQPFRGLIDAGVAAGLAWGLVALCVFSVRALLGRPPVVSLDLPDGEPASRRAMADPEVA